MGDSFPLSKWIEACETSPWGQPHSIGCVGHGMGLSLHYYEHDRPFVLLSVSRGTVIDATVECRGVTMVAVTPDDLRTVMRSLYPDASA